MALDPERKAMDAFDHNAGCWHGNNAETNANLIADLLRNRYRMKVTREEWSGEHRLWITQRRCYWNPSPSMINQMFEDRKND